VRTKRVFIVHQRFNQAFDQIGGNRLTCRQVSGSDEGLHGVGQNRILIRPAGLLFALAQQNARAEVDAPCDARQSLGRHQGCATLSELALGKLRKRGVEQHRHGLAQHGVAQKLKAFVVGRTAAFVGERTVRERQLAQPRVDIDTEQHFYIRTRGHEW